MQLSAVFHINIIITHYNDTNNLITTLKSIASQSYRHYKVHIVDAGTPQMEDRICSLIDDTRLIVTTLPGVGIYEGMNYGISCVPNGEMFQILNAGSVYCNENSLEVVVSKMKTSSTLYVCTASLEYIEGDERTVYPSPVKFPFDIFHEACIYPSATRIYHRLDRSVSADIYFLMDMDDFCKSTVYTDVRLIRYLKGGRSDSDIYTLQKIKCYVEISLRLLKRGRYYACWLYMLRVAKDCFLIIKSL